MKIAEYIKIYFPTLIAVKTRVVSTVRLVAMKIDVAGLMLEGNFVRLHLFVCF